MADELKYIPNDDTLNYPCFRSRLVLERLETSLNEPIDQNLIISHKVVELTKKKVILKTLGNSIINIPMSPPSLVSH